MKHLVVLTFLNTKEKYPFNLTPGQFEFLKYLSSLGALDENTIYEEYGQVVTFDE